MLLLLAEAHVVGADEIDHVLDGAGDVVVADVLEVVDQPAHADVVVVRSKDHAGPL